MASAPWFVAGPGALLAMLGHVRDADTTVPTPVDDWRLAVVDAVIPICLHQDTIIHCLASLLLQTRLPRRVMLVDDGGPDRDHTLLLVREFARANGVALEIIARGWSIGRAVTLKRQSREFEGDVLLVLDADTVLESPDFIERCVRELYQGVGIASATGRQLPLLPGPRAALEDSAPFRTWLGDDPRADSITTTGRWQVLARALGAGYQGHLARLQQDFFDAGLMRAHGGVPIGNGGAVVYRRRYLSDVFNRYEPYRGDDLTHLDDHFIGMALMNAGYRNIRVADVVARTHVSPLTELPADARRWTGGFLQLGYYFDVLLRSPLRRWQTLRAAGRRGAGRIPQGEDARLVREAYRQGFGERNTLKRGRPLGLALVTTALERIGYPVLLWVLALTGQWGAMALVVGLETAATAAIAAWVASDRRGLAVLHALAWSPLRYALILLEPACVGWFAIRLWWRRELGWYVRRDHDGRSRPKPLRP
ncbi:MAG: glycosyltransferase [Lysobacter sp.]